MIRWTLGIFTARWSLKGCFVRQGMNWQILGNYFVGVDTDILRTLPVCLSCLAQYLLNKVSFLPELRLAEKEVGHCNQDGQPVSVSGWAGE